MLIDEKEMANNSIAAAYKFCAEHSWSKDFTYRYYDIYAHSWEEDPCWVQRPATTD